MEPSSMLKTPLTTDWGLRYPIFNAPMTPAAGGSLARAVTAAGALGIFGVGETWAPEHVERHARLVRDDDPSAPLGIGFGWWIAHRPDLLEAAIAQRPTLVAISFIDPTPYVERLHAGGIRVAAQVQCRADAEVALRAGVDVLVAQGTEAGGHTGDVSTLTMLQIALGLTDRPVLAAGGIASPAGLAAVIAAGAAGAWIGTPFLLALEAEVSDAARARISAADETQTVLTGLFDRVQGLAWPERFRGRALRNAFTARWHGREAEAVHDPHVVAAFNEARRTEDFEIANIYAGQSAGLIGATLPAAAIVERLGNGAEALLRARLATVL